MLIVALMVWAFSFFTLGVDLFPKSISHHLCLTVQLG